MYPLGRLSTSCDRINAADLPFAINDPITSER
jgi:hypothetical protein